MPTLIAMGLFLPLLGFLVNGIFCRTLPRKWFGWIGTGSVGLSFLAFGWLTLQLLQMPIPERMFQTSLGQWLSFSAGSPVFWNLRFDPLSATMALVVTGVGFLIHLYSIGYMAEDKGVGRYFAFLNLFTAAMLLLVLADNLLVLFVGWEGVGLCSYLLIGFWWEDEEKAEAGKKAFIVNRIGDAAFLLGLFLIFAQWKTLSISELSPLWQSLTPEIQWGLLSAIALLLFGGAVGKSAQLPLSVWLPDAMAGPTPVSALIHAATMVTAGVYMIVRLNLLYSLVPVVSDAIAGVGVMTALFAATVALTQTDIKRVLAYSTISQLGFMFLAVGSRAYDAAIFHLVTHAFFKALLFLGAGAVIHLLNGEHDLRKMGGMRRQAPLVYWTFLFATLTIIGIPGLSGFFSKDEILWKVLSQGTSFSRLTWLLALIAAALTAVYMIRLFYFVFLGERRRIAHGEAEHALPANMTLPLAVLALLSAFGGILNLPHLFAPESYAERLSHFLSPLIGGEIRVHEAAPLLGEGVAMALASLIAVGLSSAALLLFLKRPDWTTSLAKGLSPIYRLLLNKYWLDELYDWLIVRPYVRFSTSLWQIVDVKGVDGSVNGVAVVARTGSTLLSFVQSGLLQSYALAMLFGGLIFGVFVFLRMLR
ncbi:MAG: NADH-quinone oxidoreductase subunit L [Deltaproteobacteria bacterium]|nr:NADH-quinone oxidoreductase subunit L [Deltaproteobacteria bacterium]